MNVKILNAELRRNPVFRRFDNDADAELSNKVDILMRLNETNLEPVSVSKNVQNRTRTSNKTVSRSPWLRRLRGSQAFRTVSSKVKTF